MEFKINRERYAYKEPVVVSRGTYTHSEVLTLELFDSSTGVRGLSECSPTEHYAETLEGSIAQIEAAVTEAGSSLSRDWLLDNMAPGAARNALDCALWDLQAKQSNRSIWELVNIERPPAIASAITLSMGSPDYMANLASQFRQYPVLKLKLGSPGDDDRLLAVREAAPDSILMLDANEGWTFNQLVELMPVCEQVGIKLIEQPLPAGADEELDGYDSPIPLAADESCHTRADLDVVARRYQSINMKLDKTGGLTEGLALAEAARVRNLTLMVGCMGGSSLAIAPALVLASLCRWVDLDGPMLLAQDREPAINYVEGEAQMFTSGLWG